MRKLFVLSVLVCVLFSCDNNSKKKKLVGINKNIIKKEVFDGFFVKFNNDSIFQFSRIIYPLKNEIYDTESGQYSNEYIKRENWKYFNFTKLPKSYIMTLNKLKNDNNIINIQIDDTGINIDYYFTLKRDKWFLVKIIDHST